MGTDKVERLGQDLNLLFPYKWLPLVAQSTCAFCGYHFPPTGVCRVSLWVGCCGSKVSAPPSFLLSTNASGDLVRATHYYSNPGTQPRYPRYTVLSSRVEHVEGDSQACRGWQAAAVKCTASQARLLPWQWLKHPYLFFLPPLPP